MIWFTEIILFITAKSAAVSFLGAVTVFLWSAWQFLDVRRRDFKNREFEIYHRLIKELVQPDKDVGIFIDRQIAIVFELRRFERYSEVSVRMLKSLKELWSKDQTNNKHILEEIDLALGYLIGSRTALSLG